MAILEMEKAKMIDVFDGIILTFYITINMWYKWGKE